MNFIYMPRGIGRTIMKCDINVFTYSEFMRGHRSGLVSSVTIDDGFPLIENEEASKEV